MWGWSCSALLSVPLAVSAARSPVVAHDASAVAVAAPAAATSRITSSRSPAADPTPPAICNGRRPPQRRLRIAGSGRAVVVGFHLSQVRAAINRRRSAPARGIRCIIPGTFPMATRTRPTPLPRACHPITPVADAPIPSAGGGRRNGHQLTIRLSQLRHRSQPAQNRAPSPGQESCGRSQRCRPLISKSESGHGSAESGE